MEAMQRLGGRMVSPALAKGLGIASMTVTVGMSALAWPLSASAAPPEAGTTLVVQPGDTLTKISQQVYGAPDHVKALASANGIADPDRIYAGTTLTLPDAPVPPSETATVVVEPGDTLRKISQRVYGDETRFPEIAQANGLQNPDLVRAGARLKVPAPAAGVAVNAALPASGPRHEGIGGATGQAAASNSSARSSNATAVAFQWPARGITVPGGEFGAARGGTGVYATHTGLDLAAPQGTAITAAAAGRVTHAGPEGSYGNTVVIDHGNGYQTRYAHLLSWKVAVGDTVNQGQLIGLMGSTGFSTGPHLHFEVIKDGKFISPLTVLPNP
jgi:murein DD-endopeptidase MepM/ murein hydrolase activator NlpD